MVDEEQRWYMKFERLLRRVKKLGEWVRDVCRLSEAKARAPQMQKVAGSNPARPTTHTTQIGKYPEGFSRNRFPEIKGLSLISLGYLPSLVSLTYIHLYCRN